MTYVVLGKYVVVINAAYYSCVWVILIQYYLVNHVPFANEKLATYGTQFKSKKNKTNA
jgi:hypothetical protein